MNIVDCYQTFGVKPFADFKEIKKAYRLLVKKYHPDLNPTVRTASHNFIRVKNAYDTLALQHENSIKEEMGLDHSCADDFSQNSGDVRDHTRQSPLFSFEKQGLSIEDCCRLCPDGRVAPFQ